VSQVAHTWWKNLRGGAPVTVRVRGQTLTGMGQAVEDVHAVSAGLLLLLKRQPSVRRFYRLTLTSDGQPTDPAALAQAARANVIVRITDLKHS
jgi:hypothetical protein